MKDVDEAFVTTDFGMAACMLAMTEKDQPVARLVDMRPQPRRAKNPGDGFKFSFFLVAGSDAVTLDRLKAIELDYVNRRLTVEPVAFQAQQRQLRYMLDRHISDAKRKQRGQ